MTYNNFKPQLAEDIGKVKGDIDFSDKLASLKLDGIRVCTLQDGAYTRSMKSVANRHIDSVLRQYPFLDGEVIMGEPNASDVYSKTQSAVNTIAGEPDFKYYVFDDLTNINKPFEYRLKALQDRDLPSFIVKHAHFDVASQEGLDACYAGAMDTGYEGLILRNKSSLYKFGRCTAKSQDMLKAKPFDYGEAVVIEVCEAMHNGNEAFVNELGRTGRSSHQENLVGKGMAGGFLVEDCVSGARFYVAAGILTHSERVEVWDSRMSIPGKILRYKYMPYGIKESTGIPRFPRFYGWRSIDDMA